MKLGNPKNTIEVIQKYDFDFQKKFGQNFLIDGGSSNKKNIAHYQILPFLKIGGLE